MDPDSVTESKTIREVKIDIPADLETHGYDRLASFMGFFPEAAIFRRFAALNAKNILYLQAELLWLENELDAVAEEDAQSSDAKRREYSKEWFLLRQSEHDPDGHSDQWKIFKKIRKTLDQYNTAILQQREIVELQSPGRLALSLVNEWMQSPKMGKVYLIGKDKDLWTTTQPHELLALDRREHDDLLSAWISKLVRAWLHPAIGRNFKRHKSAQFMERSIVTQKAILRITSVIALGLSSILPLCSILVLNTVHRVSVRLGIVTAFTVIFSLSLGLVTGARRVEIFSAAAAYAAVQVVFIAGNGPSPVPEKQP